MPATRKGVFHNLKESEYVISNKEITFSFSSKFYMHNFLSKFPDNREKFFEKFAKIVVENPYNLAFLADLTLYQEIEKRGFHIEKKGVKMSWHESHLYALEKMTNRNTNDWYVTQKQK